MYLTELTWTFNFLQEVDGNEDEQLREDESGEADPVATRQESYWVTETTNLSGLQRQIDHDELQGCLQDIKGS